jgi:hypothetical protein
MPAGWIFVADFGIRQMVRDAGAVAASVGVGQDTLTSPGEFAEYLEKQKKLIEGALKEARIAGPQATPFAGADEAHLLFVRHTVSGAGSVLHAQTYVRVGKWVGIITLTSLEDQLKAVRADYDVFVKGLRIRQYSGSDAGARA